MKILYITSQYTRYITFNLANNTPYTDLIYLSKRAQTFQI